MTTQLKPSRTSGLFSLKFRYQFMLLWLPIVVGVVLMLFGGDVIGRVVADNFGIDPNGSILAQPHGNTYAFILIGSLVGLLLLGTILAYLAIALTLRLVLGDWKTVREILLGKTYPQGWRA